MNNSVLDYKPSGKSKLLPHIKDAWIEALRGNRRQIRRVLKGKRDDGRTGYCCLGVLCDLGDKSSQRWEKDITLSGRVEWKYDGNISFPPLNVYDKSGLDVEDAKTLAQMNDNGIGFKRIATWIERNL